MRSSFYLLHSISWAMEPNENYPRSSLGPVDYDKTLDEYWQSICQTNPSEKAKKSQNPEEQIRRYPENQKPDEKMEKALLVQRLANEIQKEANLMEADDKKLRKAVKEMKTAADQILKTTFQMTKKIGYESRHRAQLLVMEEELRETHSEEERIEAVLGKRMDELDLQEGKLEEKEVELNLREEQLNRREDEQRQRNEEQQTKDGEQRIKDVEQDEREKAQDREGKLQRRRQVEQELEENYLIRRHRVQMKEEDEWRMRKEKHGMDGGKVDCHSFLLALGQEVLREDREILRNNNIYVGPGVEKLQSCCTR